MHDVPFDVYYVQVDEVTLASRVHNCLTPALATDYKSFL